MHDGNTEIFLKEVLQYLCRQVSTYLWLFIKQLFIHFCALAKQLNMDMMCKKLGTSHSKLMV